MVRDARRRAPHHEGMIPTAAAIDSLRHPRVSATALIAGGASEASLEGCQHAGTRDRPSRPAQERGHLRMTVTVWCRWYDGHCLVPLVLEGLGDGLRPNDRSQSLTRIAQVSTSPTGRFAMRCH